MRIPSLVLPVLLLAVPAAAQVVGPLRQSKLDKRAADPRYQVPLDSTVDGRWLGGGATSPRWDLEGQWAYFQFDTNSVALPTRFAEAPWWRVSRDGSKLESVSREAASQIPGQVAYTKDRGRAGFFHRGELRYWKRGNTDTRLLIARSAALQPRWSADEKEIRYVDNNELYAIDPESGIIRQLTRTFTPKDPERPDKVKDELKREQLAIFDFLKDNKTRTDTTNARAYRDRIPQPIPVPVKREHTVSQVELAPNGEYVTFLSSQNVQNTQTIYGDYVNESGAVEQRTARPKVGEKLPQRLLGIVRADPLAVPDSLKVTWVDTAGFGKAVTTTAARWNPQGTRLIVEFHSMDYKDGWTTLVDPETGKRIKVLDHEHDDAWLGGAGRTGGRGSGRYMEFLPDGERIAVTSERTGWAHLYLLDMQGTLKPLTSGDWEVRDVWLSADGSKFWLITSLEHPAETHLYTLPVEGGEMKRVDPHGEGEISRGFGGGFAMTPDESAVAYLFGTPTEHNDVFVQPTSVGSKATRITVGGTDAFYRIPWAATEFVSWQDDQGKPVFARVYKPARPHPKRPTVMEIHGAGYAQYVHKTFASSSAHGGSLYAQYLTQRGFLYVVPDYRGSAGYGRDSRTSVYRSMGDRDVASAVAAVPYLKEKYGSDPKRVGLFGCSYGGFYTLMALFKHPGTFAAGVAQCSVTDWAHYNHSYTARILNGAPAEDTAAYRVSSPIWHAAGLQDRLIIQHGLVDGNVQYQDAVRLVQRLIELGKDFEFVTYPIEGHGWFTRASQLDSQRRMTKLWEEALLGDRARSQVATSGSATGSTSGGSRNQR